MTDELAWTTGLPTLLGKQALSPEGAVYMPADWPAHCPAVIISLAHGTLTFIWRCDDCETEHSLDYHANRPAPTEEMIADALRFAGQQRALFAFMCKTRGQALRGARQAARHLPQGYHRVPLERLGVPGGLDQLN